MKPTKRKARTSSHSLGVATRRDWVTMAAARRVARDLFTVCNGTRVEHLRAFTTLNSDGKYLGGWCEEAVARRIYETMRHEWRNREVKKARTA